MNQQKEVGLFEYKPLQTVGDSLENDLGGVADGLNRPVSMFVVTVPRIDNANLLPFLKQPWPYGATRGTLLLLGVGSKGATVVKDAREAVGDKK